MLHASSLGCRHSEIVSLTHLRRANLAPRVSTTRLMHVRLRRFRMVYVLIGTETKTAGYSYLSSTWVRAEGVCRTLQATRKGVRIINI